MNLILPDEVRHQLTFLIAEVRTQLQTLCTLINTPSSAMTRSLMARSGQSHNLRQRVHARCLRAFQGKDPFDAQSLKAAGDIADELERIASLCRDSARELQQLQQRRLLLEFRYVKRLQQIDTALQRVDRIITSTDTRDALKISRVQQKLQRFYARTRKAHLKQLQKHRQAEPLITSLFIARHLVDMGAALVNMSEALISVRLGQPMNLDQYLSLKALINNLGLQKNLAGLSLEQIAETRSGSSISALANEPQNQAFIGVLKEGESRKVLEERKGLQRWNSIYPGIAPQILSHHDQGGSSALIIEHLPGRTLEQLLIKGPDAELEAGVARLAELIPELWQLTQRQGEVSARYLQQLKKRLPSILNVHPEFAQPQQGRSVLTWLKAVESMESQLKAPFSVYIHGDFNLDNILYDAATAQIRFIDLHRSQQMDYVQDVSVFMVSCLRLPLFDDAGQARVGHSTRAMYQLAQSFASTHKDTRFEQRLALGLARSLITSTRFILDKTHARSLLERGLLLLEDVQERQAQKDYRIPLEALLHV